MQFLSISLRTDLGKSIRMHYTTATKFLAVLCIRNFLLWWKRNQIRIRNKIEWQKFSQTQYKTFQVKNTKRRLQLSTSNIKKARCGIKIFLFEKLLTNDVWIQNFFQVGSGTGTWSGIKKSSGSIHNTGLFRVWTDLAQLGCQDEVPLLLLQGRHHVLWKTTKISMFRIRLVSVSDPDLDPDWIPDSIWVSGTGSRSGIRNRNGKNDIQK